MSNINDKKERLALPCPREPFGAADKRALSRISRRLCGVMRRLIMILIFYDSERKGGEFFLSVKGISTFRQTFSAMRATLPPVLCGRIDAPPTEIRLISAARPRLEIHVCRGSGLLLRVCAGCRARPSPPGSLLQFLFARCTHYPLSSLLL